ncbi:hypothetical protein [Marinobacter alexandrii]|uniref:hypothetical protein n=1 Tax=Marinobacter alexandrii TaxID=2570351 RepID=UPI003299FBB3
MNQSKTTPYKKPLGMLKLSLFGFLTTLALLLTNFPTWGWPGGDGWDYANITEAIVEGGTLDLRYATRTQRGTDDKTVIRAQDGSVYSVFPIGKSIVQVPALYLARELTRDSNDRVERMVADNLAFSVTSAVLYGISGVLLFTLLNSILAFSWPVSLMGTGLYCFATLGFVFSKMHAVENLQIVLLMGLVVAGLRSSGWSLPAVCLCFGWLVVSKPPSAVALPVFLYLVYSGRLWQLSNWNQRALAILVAVGCACLLFYYNWLRSGHMDAAYGVDNYASNTEFSLANILPTLYPLLIGPERNIFLNNSVLIFSLIGIFTLGDRRYLITSMGLWITMLLLYGASGNSNWGAYVGNARYTVPFLFLLVPFAVSAIVASYSRTTGWMRAGFVSASIMLVLSSLYVQLLYASFSEFHVKQFESRFNQAAVQYKVPEIDIAKHQLLFAHELFWRTDSCRKPVEAKPFAYPSSDLRTSTFSLEVLKTFDSRWFCKDWLFWNTSQFSTLNWLSNLRVSIFVFFCLALTFLAENCRRLYLRLLR